MMRGQPSSLKPRKRKSNCEVRSSRKVCATGKRCVKSPKRHTSGEGGDSKAEDDVETRSHIACECHHASRTRCSASPELPGQEGKENELKPELDLDLHGCEANDTLDKQEPEDMDCEEIGRSIFPDDDSNQILPVEQFFGNLDAIQDFPQRSSAASAHVQRHSRRRRYYAPEDSDEEEAGLGDSRSDHAAS